MLTIPNTFINGTTINAAPFNQNFGNIVTWSTAIDNTNIGPAGLFPNQLLPTTGAQATFGATATGVGYKLLANDATATPLTVSGTSGQSQPILNVTSTNGGTSVFGIASTGAAFIGAIPNPSANSNNLLLTVARGDANAATSGIIYFGNGTAAQTGSIVQSANTLQLASQNNSAGFFQVNGNGSVQAAPTINSVNTPGYLGPFYTNAGAATLSSVHTVFGQIVASGSTTTINFTGAAAFAANNYSVKVIDVSAKTIVTAFTTYASSSISWTSTNGDFYTYEFTGP